MVLEQKKRDLTSFEISSISLTMSMQITEVL